MTREEAIKMIKAKLECMTRDVSGRDSDCIDRRCDECPLNYEQGNMGEQKEWLRTAIKALQQQPSEGEQIIRISKGTLKARTGKYVIYDVEWLKEHFNTTEAKIYGQTKAEGARGDIPLQQSVPKMPQPSEHTEMHECDCISKTGHWEWVQYESKPNFGNWHCSECRCILCGEIKENPIRLPKYCPECGAKMQEEKK